MSIQLNHLTHVYNEGTTFEKVALNDVTLEIQTGEFIGLIGHTGSGKSTLIQHLNGIISPSSGEILLDGENIHKDRGITVILVSHSMEDVARLVDRIIVMHKGKVAMTGTPREIFSHPMELEQMGLAAPQVSYVFAKLKEKGYDVPTDIYTVEEARDALLKLVKQVKA